MYPNGWFGLIQSEELAVGASTAVNALGQNFAIFRDEEGKVHILDAYCAHLGANLAVGGKVRTCGVCRAGDLGCDSLVPRPLPPFQCCTLKSERAWYTTARDRLNHVTM